MRWTAKAGQEKLEWSILDVEQDAWERRLAELGVAAAANGFPVQPAHREPDEGIPPAPLLWSVPHNMRRVLPIVALLAVLGSVACGLAGYGVWRTAQEGIVRIQGDVANAVKVETVQANSLRRGPAMHESVQAVEFLGSAAQASVLVTRTLATGGVSVLPELRFYVQTPKGWQRSDPIAAFWGSTDTLDTAHLHFVFGRRDRTVVEQVAPGAEAVYTMLRRATGQEMTVDGLETIEILPDVLSQDAQSGGRIRMTSPALYPTADQDQPGTLGRLLRLTLRRQLLAEAAERMAAKPQWQSLVQGLGAWLADTKSMPFAPDNEDATPLRARYGLQGAWQLDDLLGEILRYDSQSQSMQVFTLISDAEEQKRRETAAEQLVDYIAATYGIDVLAGLLRGVAQYDDWEKLAPAVFGVSAAELEEGWHTAVKVK